MGQLEYQRSSNGQETTEVSMETKLFQMIISFSSGEITIILCLQHRYGSMSFGLLNAPSDSVEIFENPRVFSSQITRMVQVDSKRFINCQHLSVSSAPVAVFSLRDNVKLIVITKPFICQPSRYKQLEMSIFLNAKK